MAKKFPAGPCVHCLTHVENPTSDHVFPKAWYPDSTPQNLEKWQIPSCEKCNREFGKIEQELLLKMALCLDSEAWASQGLGKKVVDAINPARARSKRDEQARINLGFKLLRSMHTPKGDRPIVAMTPNASGQAVSIELAPLERVGVKIIRGIVFIHTREFIGQAFDVFCNALPDPAPRWMP